MSWEKKLVIGMLTFMSFIIVLGVLMVGSEPDPLVDEDYYEKGLNYDREMKLKENQAARDSILAVPSSVDHE